MGLHLVILGGGWLSILGRGDYFGPHDQHLSAKKGMRELKFKRITQPIQLRVEVLTVDPKPQILNASLLPHLHTLPPLTLNPASNLESYARSPKSPGLQVLNPQPQHKREPKPNAPQLWDASYDPLTSPHPKRPQISSLFRPCFGEMVRMRGVIYC